MLNQNKTDAGNIGSIPIQICPIMACLYIHKITPPGTGSSY